MAATIVNLDNEPGHYNFVTSDQEEVKIKVEPTPESSAATGLGTSILQSRNTAPPAEPIDDEALNARQQALFAQFAASHELQEAEQDLSELGEGFQDPIQQELQYMQDKAAYDEMKRNGELTAEDEREFMKKESAYTKRKRELQDMFNDNEDPLFEPETKRPKKKSKTKASTTSLRPTNPNLRAHNNFWEDADAAEQMNTEPDYEEIAVGRGGRAAARKGLEIRVGKEAGRLDMKRLEQAGKSFTGKNGLAKNARSILPVERGWKVKGMNTPLKVYQVINAAWMRTREMGANEPRGGIIADQMGLGKTVTCIANIVNGRPLRSFPPHLRPESHTTLIVVPTNLVKQWKSELKRHTIREVKRKQWGLGMVKVFRDSQSADLDLAEFSRYDVVLTTYYDVRASWPDCKFPEGLSEAERDAYWKENYANKRGHLHKHRFLRIVLDEGHQIANPETQTARACFSLIADHKWVLTGTPMINGSKDLYSLLHFIGHPTVERTRFESFKSRFCNTKNPQSLDALGQEMVDSVACFTHKDKLFDARLITLPKPHNRSLVLNPTKLELEIYHVVRARFRERAQTLNEKGELKTNKLHIWAMYTLLRQMTAHPLLVPAKVSDYLELSDFERLEKAVERQIASGETALSTIHAFRDSMRARRTRTEIRTANGITLDASDSSPTDDYDEGIDEVEELRAPEVIKKTKKTKGTGGVHGRNVAYAGYVEAIKRSTNFHVLSDRARCCKCDRPADRPVMAPCFHIYCYTHLEDMMHEAAANSDDSTMRTICIKPGCRREIEKTSVVDPDAASKAKWIDNGGNVLPSTKTLAVKSQILNWLDPKSGGDPDAKCIIFCQWKTFLYMLSTICETEKWEYVTLHGGMSKSARDDSIDNFKHMPKIKILIATLKTGGQGLNLTCARYVLNVDPYWNSAAEIQAFSRVYRIGQEHETEFVNLTLAGTIDEHLNRIKERKKKEIDQVSAGHKKLSMEDLLKTFEPLEEVITEVSD
ncbi:hypothetical protein QM012_006672 [Aureobasidium pullulans]|uniref:Helicase C-terminal domain-containing protein n=1 Tax=Aureobasidium pullulans TaxID=5580 RepID=A0ABR0TQ67_AURPU